MKMVKELKNNIMKITFKNQSNYIRKFLLKEFQKTFDNTNRDIIYYKDAILEVEQCLLNEHCEKAISKLKFYKSQLEEFEHFQEFIALQCSIFNIGEEIYINVPEKFEEDIVEWVENFLNGLIDYTKKYKQHLFDKGFTFRDDILINNNDLNNELVDIICEQIVKYNENKLEN